MQDSPWERVVQTCKILHVDQVSLHWREFVCLSWTPYTPYPILFISILLLADYYSYLLSTSYMKRKKKRIYVFFIHNYNPSVQNRRVICSRSSAQSMVNKIHYRYCVISQKGGETQENFGVMAVYYLIVIVSQVYTYVHTHQIIYIKCQFFHISYTLVNLFRKVTQKIFAEWISK